MIQKLTSSTKSGVQGLSRQLSRVGEDVSTAVNKSPSWDVKKGREQSMGKDNVVSMVSKTKSERAAPDSWNIGNLLGDYGDDDSSEGSDHYVLSPRFNRMVSVVIALMVALFLLYSMTVEPMRMAFLDSSDAWYHELATMGLIVDSFFCFDLLKRLIPDKLMGIRQYLASLQSRFSAREEVTAVIIDLLSSVPFYQMFEVRSAEGLVVDPNPLMLLRYLRALRFVRVFGFVVRHLTSSQNARRRLDAVIFGLFSFILVHMIACFWYLLARWHNFNDKTWAGRIPEFETFHKGKRYMASIHDILQVVRTRTGNTPIYYLHEYLVTFISMLLGIIMIAWITSSLANIVFQQDKQAKELEENMSLLEEFAERLQIPPHVKKELYYEVEVNHNDEGFTQVKKQQKEFAETLMLTVESDFRCEVVNEMFQGRPMMFSFFSKRDSVFLWTVLPLLTQRRFVDKCVIFRIHDRPELMYFLITGRVKLYVRETRTEKQIEKEKEGKKKEDNFIQDNESEYGPSRAPSFFGPNDFGFNDRGQEIAVDDESLEQQNVSDAYATLNLNNVDAADAHEEPDVRKKKMGTSQRCIREYSSGSHFGHEEVMDCSPRRATCRAARAVECFVITRADIIRTAVRFPEIAGELESEDIHDDKVTSGFDAPKSGNDRKFSCAQDQRKFSVVKRARQASNMGSIFARSSIASIASNTSRQDAKKDNMMDVDDFRNIDTMSETSGKSTCSATAAPRSNNPKKGLLQSPNGDSGPIRKTMSLLNLSVSDSFKQRVTAFQQHDGGGGEDRMSAELGSYLQTQNFDRAAQAFGTGSQNRVTASPLSADERTPASQGIYLLEKRITKLEQEMKAIAEKQKDALKHVALLPGLLKNVERLLFLASSPQ